MNIFCLYNKKTIKGHTHVLVYVYACVLLIHSFVLRHEQTQGKLGKQDETLGSHLAGEVY